jgi:hypothetical protein
MYPSIWKFISQISIFYIYDLIEDQKVKNKIQQLIKRLANEETSLKHGIDEILNEYFNVLEKVFKSGDIAIFLCQYLHSIIINYRSMILEAPSFMSCEKTEMAYWEYHIMDIHKFFNNDFSTWIKSKQLIVPGDIINCLFPFITERKTTPFNEVIKWLIEQNLVNKRQFAEEIAQSTDQLDSYVKKVQRWTTSSHIPNFVDVKSDLEDFVNKYPAKEMRDGVLLSIYLSIAFSKMYRKKLNPVLEKEIRSFITIKAEDFDIDVQCVIENQKSEESEYISTIYNPIHELLKIIQLEKYSLPKLETLVNELINEKESLIEKYYAECYVFYLKARIFYFQDKYKEAKDLYYQAYLEGRYRIGREIKVIIYELLHCCRKTEDRKLFERVVDWLTYFLDQKFEKLLSFETKTMDEIWEDFNNDTKYRVFTNRYTGKVGSVNKSPTMK